jgi:fumarate hydratase class I
MQHCKACLSACGVSDAVEDAGNDSNVKNLLENLPSSTKTATFSFSPIFQSAPEAERAAIRFTPPAWKKIEGDFAEVIEIPLPGGKSKKILNIKKGALATLAQQCIIDVQHFFRHDQLGAWAHILRDPEASDNDRFVATQLLKNACISAGQVLPSCQDTGTAIVMGKKGEQVWTEDESSDEEGLSHGIWLAYQNHYLRYSQTAALDMFEEVNTKNNLPAQIDLLATKGCEYNFLVVAKGGGSANKSYLYQQTKALLNPKSLRAFIREKLKTLGTSACPPYTIALVIGGTSAEMTMKTVKLASCRYYDNLPTTGDASGRAFRDVEWERIVLEEARDSHIGAQFGGKYFAHQVRVIRLPRHGASCPVGLGVSCSADRQILAKITSEGMFLEQLEYDPAKYLPESIANPQPIVCSSSSAAQVEIDLNMGMDALRKTLSQYPIRTRLLLNGDLIVARDIAHAKIQERLDSGLGLPEYVKNNVIYYAGPAKTPSGEASGSFGPTTAGRMDSYVPTFMEKGGSYVTLAKGNRSKQVTDSCQKHGGFFLGSIGGAAAILARDNITKVEVVEFPELGMEAVWKISVKNFPAFIVVDDKGNDFFEQL